MKKTIFSNTENGLATKVHLKYFVEIMDEVANLSEDVADRLIISSSKKLNMLDILLIATIAIILGANDASNVFGSAVGSKMIKFKVAVVFFIIFIVLGALINAENPSKIYSNLIFDYPKLSQIFLIIIPVVIVTIFSLKLKIPSSIFI